MRRIRRATLRKLLRLHTGFLENLIVRIDKGREPLSLITQQWKAECGSIKDIESVFGTHLAQANRKGRS